MFVETQIQRHQVGRPGELGCSPGSGVVWLEQSLRGDPTVWKLDGGLEGPRFWVETRSLGGTQGLGGTHIFWGKQRFGGTQGDGRSRGSGRDVRPGGGPGV